jgi:hypothetical protein
MQSNEKVVLIPGDPERVKTVQQMFRRRLIDGWSGFRIARELDRMGIRSGNGAPWSSSTINGMLVNPVYTGVGIANRYSSAIYNRRSANAPKPSLTNRKTLATRKTPKCQIRPRNEWIEVEHPQLRNYLGDLRDRAVAWQKEQLKKQDTTRIKTPASKDRHVDSSYFLKGILRTVDGHSLTGRTVGTPRHRYYAVRRAYTIPQNDKTLRRLIPADDLERAVLDIVRDILLSTPDLNTYLIKQIEAQRKAMEKGGNDLAKLESQRAKIAQQIELAIDALGPVGQDAAKAKLQQLEAKLTAVVQQIEQARGRQKSDDRSPESIADEIIASLTKAAATIPTLPMPMLRSLLMTLIARLEVDLTTKAVEIELAIPVSTSENALCLEYKFLKEYVYQAQMKIPLGSAKCSYRRVADKPCFDCRRIKKAA